MSECVICASGFYMKKDGSCYATSTNTGNNNNNGEVITPKRLLIIIG